MSFPSDKDGYLLKWWLANEIVVTLICPFSKYLSEETRRFAIEAYDVIRLWKDERQ